MKSDRRFVRVKDLVRLRYKIIDAAGLDRARQELEFLRARDAQAGVARQRLSTLHDSATEAGFQLVLEALARVEQKIDHVIDNMEQLTRGSEAEVAALRATHCDLSAAGMQFTCEEKLVVNTYLVMTIFLGHATGSPVHLVAQVRRSDENTIGWGADPWVAAVEFVDLSEVDRERIIAHVFDVQRALIRSERESTDQS